MYSSLFKQRLIVAYLTFTFSSYLIRWAVDFFYMTFVVPPVIITFWVLYGLGVIR